jgi:ribonuclease HI
MLDSRNQSVLCGITMKLYTDGSCMNQIDADHKKRIMRIVVTDENGTVLVDKTKTGGSSNVAELWAVTEALLYVKNCEIPANQKIAEIFMDSQNNFAWLNGRVGHKINDKKAVSHLLTAVNRLREKVKLKLTWIPREENLAGIYLEQNP